MEHEELAGGPMVRPVEAPGDANPRSVRIKVGDYSTWRPVAQLLATRAHIVAPDLAGFGESSVAPAKFHAADHARLIVALIRTLGLRRSTWWDSTLAVRRQLWSAIRHLSWLPH